MIFISFFIITAILTQSLCCMDSPNQPLIRNNNEIVIKQSQYDTSNAQFLENPDTPKRLKMEIHELLAAKDKNFIINAYCGSSKTHPYEAKITLYDNETDTTKTIQHILTCKIPVDYPFKSPLLLLESNDPRFIKDIITIKNSLKDQLSSQWSPGLKISTIIDMTYKKLSLYKKMISATAQSQIRTIDHLKAEYLNKKTIVGYKYPEFQEKLKGLWVKETSFGYLVFQVHGDYIDIAFESKDTNTKPLLYHGSCAIGSHIPDKNKFSILMCDNADLGKSNGFQLYVSNNSISLQFYKLEDNSILESIISQLELNYHIAEYIDLKKVE